MSTFNIYKITKKYLKSLVYVELNTASNYCFAYNATIVCTNEKLKLKMADHAENHQQADLTKLPFFSGDKSDIFMCVQWISRGQRARD